jgi:hypothetical protein
VKRTRCRAIRACNALRWASSARSSVCIVRSSPAAVSLPAP